MGGVDAVSYSWPSTSYIFWSYTASYILPSSNVSVGPFDFNGFCGGTLIDRKTVLTTASCIRRSVEINYNGTDYTGNVYLNSFYPTTASQYKIFLGLHNLNNAYVSPTVSFDVSQIILVTNLFFKQNFESFFFKYINAKR